MTCTNNIKNNANKKIEKRLFNTTPAAWLTQPGRLSMDWRDSVTLPQFKLFGAFVFESILSKHFFKEKNDTKHESNKV